MLPQKQKPFKVYEELIDLLDSSKSDAYRFFYNKSGYSGKELRNKLSKVAKMCIQVRKLVQEKKKSNTKTKKSYEKIFRSAGDHPESGSASAD